jgi:glycosyltransferase involved in cell wall biosynthesis
LTKKTILKKLRNKKYIISTKLLLFLVLFLIIYVFENSNLSENLFSKKHAIEYLKNFYLEDLNNINYNFTNNNAPNISVIIPLFNCQNSIENSIKSIQLQTFTNYEIILINDFSMDNTSNIINSLKEKDSRIKIINNNKNMGTLYSRSVGALSAKGKYIYCLDNDDLFYDENLFKRIYEIAEETDYDIVGFKSYFAKKYSPKFKLSDINVGLFNHHKINLSLTQPKLGLFPISKNGKYFSNDHHVWGKSIKSKIYKTAVNYLGKINYSFYNCWTEDVSIVFLLFNFAQSYIFIGIFGIIHLVYKQNTTHTLSDSKKLMAELFFLNIIIDFIQNKESNKNIIIEKLISILKSKYLEIFNKDHIHFLHLIIKKILIIKTLNKNEKELIFKYIRKIKSK